MNELAKRAVACKWWRWMPGMLIHDRVSNFFWRCGMAPSVWLTPYGVHTDRVDLMDSRKPPVMFRRAIKTGLVLTDPATVGCLMQMLRDAYPTAEIRISWLPADDTTTIRIDDGSPWLAGNGATLAEALVAALEAQRCPV